jgi:type IV secretory pathway VirB3-like protein
MDRTQVWLVSHTAQVPMSPAVLNAGLAGVIALMAVAAWYAVLHAPALVARLIVPQ